MAVLSQPVPQLSSPAASWGSPMQMQPLVPEKGETELTVKGLNSPSPGNSCGDLDLGETLIGLSYHDWMGWVVCVLKDEFSCPAESYLSHPSPHHWMRVGRLRIDVSS